MREKAGPRVRNSDEIALSGSRRLRSTLAAARQSFSHTLLSQQLILSSFSTLLVLFCPRAILLDHQSVPMLYHQRAALV
jgi:hypothetical protein